MSTVGTTTSSSSVLDNLNIDKKTASTGSKATSDKDMFMKLMLTQMQNQNPLNPADGTQFLSQLAQFSQLEGIGKINSSVQDLSTIFKSTQALQATTMVGRDVQIDGNNGYFDGNTEVTGVVKAGQAATNANISITDANGQLVYTKPVGDVGAGETAFGWNGTDSNGNPLPPGNYSFSVKGMIDGKTTDLNLAMNQRVSSVSIAGGTGGSMMLNLAGGTSISTDKVNKIN